MGTFLEREYAFYLMTVLLIAGTMAKLMVRRVYESLMEQTEDMAHATSEWLKQLKMHYEACYRQHGQVPNGKAFVEKHIYRYRLLFGIRMRRMEHMLLHTSVICAMLAMLTAFGAYMEKMSTEVISKHLFGGLLFAGGAFLLDMLLETESKQEMLCVYLQDYFDNTLSFKLATDLAGRTDEPALKGSIRDDIFMKKEEPCQETRLTAMREEAPMLLRDRKRGGKRLSENAVIEVMEERSSERASEKASERASEKASETVMRGAIKQTAATMETKESLHEAMLEGLKQSGKTTPEKEQLVEMIMKLVDQL